MLEGPGGGGGGDGGTAPAPQPANSHQGAPTQPLRRGKLPPSPSSTLNRPQQLRQQQREAQATAAQQDAAALVAMLGGGAGGAAALPATPARGAPPGPAAGAASGEGALTSLTLQSLLPGTSPGTAVSAALPGWAGLGASAEPSVLTAYIAGVDEEGSLAQRQLTHMQASTSGAYGGSAAAAQRGQGAGGWHAVGSPPGTLRSARQVPGRREVFVLSKWLEVETQRFNATYSRKDERTPLVDFLLLAAAKAKAIYSQAYAELTRQVTQQCEERGRLMADVWIGYAAMLDNVLSRVHAAYAVVKDRAERAEVRLEMAESALEQERCSGDAYKVELQDEVARLRAELTAALSMGGGGGHMDVMAAVLGPRGHGSERGSGGGGAGSPPRGSVAVGGGSILGPRGSGAPEDVRRMAAMRESVAPGGRSVRFRESSVSPLARGSTLKRGTAAEDLRQGSMRASMAMSAAMRQLQDTTDSTMVMGANSEEVDALQQQNVALKEALDGARQELFEVYKQMADLEHTANEVVLLESRAEAAENERDEAVEALRATTPRPQHSWDDLTALVGEQGVQRFQAALDAHRQWPTDELAQVLAGTLLHSADSGSAGAGSGAAAEPASGEGGACGQPAAEASGQSVASGRGTLTPGGGGSDGTESHLCEYALQQLGCLRAAVSQGLLSRDALKQAIVDRNVAALVEAADDEDHTPWLEWALSRRVADVDGFVDFLAGSGRSGLPISPSFYGCMQSYKWGITFDQLRTAVQRVRMSTRTRVQYLEEEVRSVQKEATELRNIVQGYRDAEQKRDAARRRREEEAQAERKNPLQQYVEMLGSQEEAAWKDWLIGMGQSAEVPKLFKHGGKIRNKNMSKRDTEKLVKEIWKERMADPAAAAGKAPELAEFVFTILQKRVGIVTAVVEAGYNFLFGLWRYQWDADCELFLRIIMGEVKEDVYVAQVRLQQEVEELFAAIDRAKGQATGFIAKEDLRTAFLSYFKVGQPGGKTLKRFDELMQAMDEDQESDQVEWKKVFEEDREFNQGEFAEAIRDQFLQERVEFFKALEDAIYDEAGHEEECTKEHTMRALLRVDHDMTEKAAQQTASAIFSGGLDQLSVKTVMRKISRGVVRRGRSSSASKMSLMLGKGGKGGLVAKKAGATLNEACLRALEALRQEWIARELQRKRRPRGGTADTMWQRWPVAQSTGLLVLLVAACCAGRGAAAVTAPPTYPTPVPNRPKYPPAALPFSRRYDWRLAGVRDGAPLLPWRSFKVGRALGAEPAGGAVVYFPPGTYVLNRTITVTRPDVVLRGAGEANTTIYIPSSLTGVLGPRFHAPGGAQPKSAWAFVGGFITLSRLSSAARRRPLGKVPRGRSVRQFGRTIPVMSSSPFKVGDRVRVFVNDESTVGVCDHEGFCRRRLLHTGTAAHKGPAALRYATAAGVLTAYPNDPGMTPPWVPAQSDLVALPQMLAAGLGDEKAYGEDFEEETGGPAGAPPPPSSPNATTLPGRNATQPFEGVLWPAAAPGTIAAWLYGDGLARSGKGNFAVDKDTVTFTAKWNHLKKRHHRHPGPSSAFPNQALLEGISAPAGGAGAALGLEHLTIQFKFDRSQPHLEDRGYNALFLQGVRNCWVRNVRILDADNGIFMHSVDHSTIQDVLVNVTRPRTWTNLAAGPHHVSGHHPVSLLHGHHNLLSRVAVGTTYSHDITVGRATTSNVISQAAGFNLNLDHHRGGPFGNLFTDIDLGCGWRPFASSGLLENGDNSGRDEVFYNLRTTRARCPVTPKFPAPPTRVGWSTLPSCDFGPLISFVGNFSGRERCPDKKWLVISTT